MSNVCIWVLQQLYIEIMLLMSLINCINAPSICYQTSLLLRVALYPSYLIVLVWIYIAVRCGVNKKKHWKAIHVAWRNCICRIWKINAKTHNDFVALPFVIVVICIVLLAFSCIFNIHVSYILFMSFTPVQIQIHV